MSTPLDLCHGPGFDLLGRVGSDVRLIVPALVGIALLLTGAVAVIARLLRSIPAAVERLPWRWTAALGRIAGSQLFGVRVLAGLGVSLGGAAVFIEIAEQVVGREELARIDLAIAECFRAHAAPAATSLWLVVTRGGSLAVLGTIGVAVAVLLFARRQRLLLTTWVAAVAGGLLLNLLLKELFQRQRPAAAVGALHEPSWSFPSGHAMLSLVAYGMIAYFIANATPRRLPQVTAVFVAALLVVAIGASRLYLGVHYLSDVAAGYGAGVLWLAVCVTAVELRRAVRDGSACAGP